MSRLNKVWGPSALISARSSPLIFHTGTAAVGRADGDGTGGVQEAVAGVGGVGARSQSSVVVCSGDEDLESMLRDSYQWYVFVSMCLCRCDCEYQCVCVDVAVK